MTTIPIGDVHLGKKFENGVPLHRRGDREKMQWAQFRQELDQDCDVLVQMGDLFDKMFVPYSVIWGAYQAYRDAPRNGRTDVILQGNHDASRDADKVSAFQIFAGLVRPLGVVVVDEAPFRIDDEVFIPWHPFLTAKEMVEKHADLIRGCHTAYGHWDVVMGEDNRLPADELHALGVTKAVTGHDHNKRDMKIGGLDVHVTGSMQPYSHGEDPEGQIYVTVSLKDLGQDLTNKCVRLVLQPNEEAPMIDCLQLQIQRLKEEIDIGEVQFEAFDLNDLYVQACKEVGLSDEMSTLTLQKLEEERAVRG